MSDDAEQQPAPELPTVRVDPERMGEHRVLIELGTVHRRFSATVERLKQTVTSVLIGEFGMKQEEAKAHADVLVTEQVQQLQSGATLEQLRTQVGDALAATNRLMDEVRRLRDERDAARAELAALKGRDQPPSAAATSAESQAGAV